MAIEEYRVTWRRRDWAKTTESKSRIFSRRCDAQRLYDKLSCSTEEWSVVTLLRFDSRPVGSWSEVAR